MLRDKNHKSILMRPLEQLSGLPSPYGFIEGLGCLYRESHGPGSKGVRVPYPPKEWILNKDVTEECVIGFMGDILDTKGLPVSIGADVVSFFAGCDAVVGNFESIITDLPGHKTSVRHTRQIVDALADSFDPCSTYLSVANNHAGDYSADVFYESIRLLENRGFKVFGWNDRPFVDLGWSVRVIGATDWSNAACPEVFMLEPELTSRHISKDSFNILFPHWGYELELHPRRSMIRKAQAWLGKGFDAIIAHHGHTPRTLYTQAADDVSSFVVDSLGDFICGFAQEWYHYGLVVKVGIGSNAAGTTAAGRTAIGQVSWDFCDTRPEGNVVTTRLRPDLSPEILIKHLQRRS